MEISRDTVKNSFSRTAWRSFATFAAVIVSLTISIPGANASSSARIALNGHTGAEAIGLTALGAVAPSTNMGVTIALSLPNRAALELALQEMYDPKNPLYHHFYTPKTFGETFGPSASDYQAVVDWAHSNGLTVTKTFDSRLIVDVAGPASAVEQAFSVHLNNYAMNGRTVRVPDVSPSVPAAMAGKISGVQGIDNVDLAIPNAVKRDDLSPEVLAPQELSPQGSGPFGGMSPSDIETAYNISPLNMDGSGQVLALWEADQYYSSDILGFESYFGITNADVESVPVNNFADPPSDEDAQGEVTLDIELMMSISPRAKIKVFQGENGLDFWNIWEAIAADTTVTTVSTSWAEPEEESSATQDDESAIFMQMAAEGQTVYASSGDSGAWYYESWIWDPASDPYICGVGATNLQLGSSSSYGSESVWNNSAGASSGGISKYWTLPTYQQGVTGLASSSWRNGPDISLDGDPATGYAVYLNGAWGVWGGTSCSAPALGGYNGLLDEELQAEGQSLLGELNPSIYPIGEGSHYSSDFHDVTVGNNNHYNAATGYDCCTGWGTIQGVNLFTDLTGYTASAAPGAPQGLTAVGAPATVTLQWGKLYGATSYNVYRGTSSGGESPTPIVTGLTNPTYTNSSLTNDVTYYYKVAAVNANGTSLPSSEVSDMPGALPAAPTSLADTVNSNVVQLTWNTSLGSGTYNVYRGNQPGGEAWAPLATGLTSASYNDTNVENGLHYYYKVAGVNQTAVGPMSNEIEGSPGGRPFPPTNLAAQGGSDQVILTWTDAIFYATSYNVYRGTTSGGESSTPIVTGLNSSAATYTDTTAINGTTYYYEVGAVNAYGATMSNEASALTAVPVAPTGLAASTAGPTSIDLTWNDSGATRYAVYRGTTSGGSYSQVGSPSTNSYTDTSCQAATNYYYVVASITNNVDSAKSTQASAETTPVAPNSLKAASSGASGVALTWGLTVGATSYVVERGSVSGGPYQQIATAYTPAYTDQVSSGTQYYYVVAAVDAGGASPVSQQASVLTFASAPTGLTATEESSNLIDLSWNSASGATSYAVQRSTRSGGPYTKITTVSSGTTYSDANVAPSTTYYYVVASVNAGGMGPNSAQASATTPPGAPSGLRATTASASAVSLTWTAITGASGYIVKYSTTSGGPYTQIGTAGSAAAPSYLATGLSAATQYYFVVEAVSNGQAGANSTQATATTMAATVTGLTAEASSSSEIDLSWNASTGATSYAVERSTRSGGPYTKVASVTNGVAYSDLHLASCTTYYYVVAAVDAGGQSASSAQASATTPPGPPSGLHAKTNGSSEIDLTWTSETGASSYIVEDSTTEGGPYSPIGTSGKASYSATGLSPATQYYFVVEAVSGGEPSANSAEATAMTAPSTPTGLSATVNSGSSVSLTWNASTGATSYYVYKATAAAGPYTKADTASSNSDTLTGLSAATTYYFEVAAVDSGGASANSSPASTTTLSAAPAGVHAKSVSDQEIDLTWIAVKGATSYQVSSSTVEGGPYSPVGTTSGLLYANTGLTPSTQYYYVVQAADAGGSSPDSSEATATTLPATPQNVTATADSGSEVTVSWSSVTGANSYIVYKAATAAGPYTKVASTSSTSDNVTGLVAGTRYYFEVAAVNNGGTGAACSPVSVTTLPATPMSVRASSISDAEIDITWSAAVGAQSYIVSWSTVEGGPYTEAGQTSSLEYKDTSVSAGTQYYFVVQASGAGGSSADSNEVTATTAPSAPSGVTPSVASASEIDLTWSASTGAVSYNIWRSTTSGAGFLKIGTTQTTSFANTGLLADKTYYYVVTATGAGGTSPNSSQTSAETE